MTKTNWVPLYDRPWSRVPLSRIKTEKPMRLRGLRCSGTKLEELIVTTHETKTR